MIAIYDPSENNVVLIGDKIYRISIPEFNSIRSALESQGLYFLNNLSVENVSTNSVRSVTVNHFDEKVDDNKKYIASNKGKSVIVNGLEPKLQFMGVDDVKSLDDLRSTYKGIPEAVQKLINSNVLLLLNDKERLDRLSSNKNKKAIKGSRVKQSSGIEERMSEENSFDFNEDGSDSEDRIFKNAVKIDL
jgi:hypothetical protein